MKKQNLFTDHYLKETKFSTLFQSSTLFLLLGPNIEFIALLDIKVYYKNYTN